MNVKREVHWEVYEIYWALEVVQRGQIVGVLWWELEQIDQAVFEILPVRFHATELVGYLSNLSVLNPSKHLTYLSYPWMFLRAPLLLNHYFLRVTA